MMRYELHKKCFVYKRVSKVFYFDTKRPMYLPPWPFLHKSSHFDQKAAYSNFSRQPPQHKGTQLHACIKKLFGAHVRNLTLRCCRGAVWVALRTHINISLSLSLAWSTLWRAYVNVHTCIASVCASEWVTDIHHPASR